MNYRHRIQYILVRKTQISFKEAAEAIASGRVTLNGKTATENVLVGVYDQLSIDHIPIQDPASFNYFAYHKPKGIECTLNPEISNSLYHCLPSEHSDLIYAGRLDKNSEGLLLLTNDGHIYNKIIHPKEAIPKYYTVKLEKEMAAGFVKKMESGVEILGKTTKGCQINILAPDQFEIVLTEGMNRQIRRMCYALGNYVTALKRTRIGPIDLGSLGSGKFRALLKEEIQQLRNL